MIDLMFVKVSKTFQILVWKTLMIKEVCGAKTPANATFSLKEMRPY